MPKISVIVPVYNAERWLPRSIDSILAQTFNGFELLLINDGSTDGSGAICDEYAARDPRIRVFHKPNGGVSSARDLGLDNVRSEWITFCCSDTIYIWATTVQNHLSDSCSVIENSNNKRTLHISLNHKTTSVDN